MNFTRGHSFIAEISSSAFKSFGDDFAVFVLGEQNKSRVVNGNHPDYIKINPEKGKNDIAIKQIRSVINELSICPFEGGKRAVVVFGADLMNAAAQNCFLKTLEEPPSNTYFLLLTNQAEMLLPTIRSRCANIHINSRSFDIPGLDEQTAGIIKALSADPYQAEEWTNSFKNKTGWWKARNDALQAIAALQDGKNAYSASTFLSETKQDLYVSYTSMMSYFRDAMASGLSGNTENTDVTDLLEYWKHTHPERAAVIIDYIETAQKMLDSNVKEKLTNEWLCFKISEVIK